MITGGDVVRQLDPGLAPQGGHRRVVRMAGQLDARVLCDRHHVLEEKGDPLPHLFRAGRECRLGRRLLGVCIVKVPHHRSAPANGPRLGAIDGCQVKHVLDHGDALLAEDLDRAADILDLAHRRFDCPWTHRPQARPMLANRGNARHAFNGPDDVNAGQHRPHASPHVFHYLETTFSGRRPKLHNVHSLNPKTQQRQPVVESRIGQKMSAPRYGPTPTPKQAP